MVAEARGDVNYRIVKFCASLGEEAVFRSRDGLLPSEGKDSEEGPS
jgi:hypothetical protein